MRKMTEGRIAGHLLAVAIPLILGNFFQLTYNAVDSIIVGKFAGEAALAAVSAANPVMTIVILGVSGISIGASVLMSRLFGAGDEEALRREVATTLLFGAAASLAVFVPGVLLSGWMLRILRVPQEILPEAAIYLRVIFVGFLFTFQYNLLSAALRSVGDTKTPVTYLAASSVLNGCLDALFVWGFDWGVLGAALATVIASAMSAISCFAHIQRRIPLLRLEKKDLRIDRTLLRETLALGSVTALQQACQPVGKVLIQSVINAQGVGMIAAFNAVTRVDDFACIPEQSISSAMTTCIAQNRGAGKKARVKETLKTGMGLELAYGAAILIVTLLIKEPVMRLFAASGSTGMVRMGVEYLSMMAFFYILPGLTNGIQGYFRGMGKMKTTLINTAIQISVRAAIVYVFVPRIGLRGAAIGCAVGWCCMLVNCDIQYRKVKRRYESE